MMVEVMSPPITQTARVLGETGLDATLWTRSTNNSESVDNQAGQPDKRFSNASIRSNVLPYGGYSSRTPAARGCANIAFS